MTMMEERVAVVAAQATEVFSNSAAALDWLKTPQGTLGGQIPIRLIMTDYGFSVVCKFLADFSEAGGLAA